MSQQIMSTGKSLRDFQQSGEKDLFQDATQLPYFFKENLVDQARVIKYFHNDSQANLRVFYYQYMKLCFQFDNPNYEYYINKIYQIITNPQFTFQFPSDSKEQLLNDKQFKRLLIQFLDYMSQGGITVNGALNSFPIMDFVLVCFFRSFLIASGKSKQFDSYIQSDTLFQFLTSYFNIEATVHDKCMKFVETDIYVYEQNPYQVYLIYIDYQKGIQGNQYQSQTQSHQSQSVNSYMMNNNKVLSPGQLSKLPDNQNQNCISRNDTQNVSRQYSSVIQSQQNSLVYNLNNKNDIVKPNNNYSNMINNYSQQSNQSNNKNTQLQQQQKKRKEMLSYMGTSDIYDFVDYTNPKNEESNNPNNQISNLIKESNMKKSNHYLSNEFQLSKKHTEIDKLQQFVSQDQKRRAQDLSSRMQTSILNNQSLSTKKETSAKFVSNSSQFGNQAISVNKIQSEKQQKSQKQQINQAKNNNLFTNNQINQLSYKQEAYQTIQSSPNNAKNQPIIELSNSNYINKSSTSKNKDFMENDKYNLSSVKPDINNLYKGSLETKINTSNIGNISNLTGLNSNNTVYNNSSQIQTKSYNSNFNNYINESYEDKMKRMTNNQLGPDHNSYIPPTNINNNIYLGSNYQSKNKTTNYEQIKQVNGFTASTVYDRNNTIDPDQQFTNSLILQNVNEPQRSSIKKMKIRARAQRKSVGGGLI